MPFVSRLMIAIACFALPASAFAETTAAPQVTNSGNGTTTFFGNPANTPSAPKPLTAATPKVQPDLPPTLVARIDLRTQRMAVSVNGGQRYVWPISSGVSQFPTPTGTFRPQWTAKMWYSRKYDLAPMPNAVFINGGVAIHATYQTAALGSPASHGCIRLSPTNAKTFYDLVARHGLSRVRVSVTGRPNWRDQVAIGQSGSSRKRAYAANDEAWFSNAWGDSESSAYTPSFGKNKRSSYVMIDGMPRKVYRRANGDLVLADRPRRRPYRAYGYGYGGYDQGY